jgi:hypothetical protein
MPGGWVLTVGTFTVAVVLIKDGLVLEDGFEVKGLGSPEDRHPPMETNMPSKINSILTRIQVDLRLCCIPWELPPLRLIVLETDSIHKPTLGQEALDQLAPSPLRLFRIC